VPRRRAASPPTDLALTGFGDLELGDLLADRTQGLTDPDDAPEAPEHPVSQTGDLWVLGRHRLLCGDSTVATDVERLLGGVEPHLMVTDPPYGVNYDAGWRGRRGLRRAACHTYATSPGNSAQASRQSATSSFITLPTAACVRSPSREQIAQLQLAKPGQRQVEAAELQLAELQAEEFAIPTRV
jgi:hypothetical protein